VAAKTNRSLTLAAAVVVIAALYLARDVLIPFALAALVSFLVSPLVQRLQRRGVPKIASVAAAMTLLLVAFGSLGWVVVNEARDFANRLPEYRETILEKTRLMRDAIEQPFERATSTVKDVSDGLTPASKDSAKAAPPEVVRLAEPPGGSLDVARLALDPLLGSMTTLAMSLLFAIIMLLRPEDLRDRVIRIVGSGKISMTTQALNEASSRVSAYLARLLLVNGALGVCFAIGLLFIGVPNALLWGLLLTCFRFVPYAGIWIAATFPIALSLATSSGWQQPLEVAGLIVALEIVASMVLEPWFYAAGTGISPLAVLLSALFWSWLWGPIGLILATPMTVCLVVLGKYVPQLHFLYLMLSDAPALPPAARLYQRLLTEEHDEAWSILKAERKEATTPAAYDAVLLPALAMCEKERQRGGIDDVALAPIEDGIQLLIKECEDAPSPIDDTIPKLQDLRVVCMPARSGADALAAEMLAHSLRLAGAEVEIVPLAEFVGETIEKLGARPADVVVISAVPPSRFLHVRYICKRLALCYPELEVVAGIWTLESGDAALREQLPNGEHLRAVTSLNETLEVLRPIAEQVRLRREHRAAGFASSA
jgi:predicted PurR-regulated permease PerM